MTDRRPDEIAIERLQNVLIAQMLRSPNVESALGSAYVQAVFAMCNAKALLNLFKKKNLVSDSELERELAIVLNEEADRRSQSKVEIAAQVPKGIRAL